MRKLLAALLAVCMLLTMLPVAAFAAPGGVKLTSIRLSGDTVVYDEDSNTYTLYFPASGVPVNYDTIFSGDNLGDYSSASNVAWKETVKFNGNEYIFYNLFAEYGYFSYNAETGVLSVPGTVTSESIGLTAFYEYSNDGGVNWTPAFTQVFACLHNSFENGICNICGEACTHDDYTNNVCGQCGFIKDPPLSTDDKEDADEDEYEEPTYRTSIEKAENGSVSVNTKNPVKAEKVTITAKPDKGYEVESVIVTDKNGNEVKVTDNGDGTYSFRQPSSKVTIKVNFVKEAAKVEAPVKANPETGAPNHYFACR